MTPIPPPKPEPLPDLWVERIRAGAGDAGVVLFVAVLVILAVALGVEQWLINHSRDKP